MDPGRDLCLGCKRTLDEIARWGAMSDEEREKVLAELPRRELPRDLNVLEVPVPPLA
jgi:predicted Fe-S protein YdhL (DUF1289 family)